MRKVFADTLYWIATVKPNDPYGPAASEAREQIKDVLSNGHHFQQEGCNVLIHSARSGSPR